MFIIVVLLCAIAFAVWAAYISSKREIKQQIDGTELYVLIEEMKFYKKTHDDWADYFQKNPEREKEYVSTGEWNNSMEHRRVASVYTRVIDILEQLKPTPQIIT